MIEIHDGWFYYSLWYVQGATADYTVLVFRRLGAPEGTCEAIARFRAFRSEAERRQGLTDGTDGWFPVHAPGAGAAYLLPLVANIVKNISVHPELGPAVAVHEHNIHANGPTFREILAAVPWAVP